MPDTPIAETESHQILPRVLGRYDAAAVVIGSIIGSGVFLKAQTIARELGDFGVGYIIGVWVVVGLITLCGSLALAELAAMLPQAGGPYIYLREAYGRLPAFLWGWAEFWIVRTGTLGALATASVIYFNDLLTTPLSHLQQEAIAIGIVILLSASNAVGTRLGANIQNLTAVLKVAFIAAVVVFPWILPRESPSFALPLFPPVPKELGWADLLRAVGAATIAVMWAYDGWINIGPVAEEIQEPQKNIPWALTIGLIVVIVTYVGANLSYHVVLPMQAVRDANAVAADTMRALFINWGTDWGIWAQRMTAVGIMCSTFGAVNSNLITGPRIYLAMARDRLLPRFLCAVHPRFQTPFNAIVLQAIWSVALIVIAFAWKSGPGDSLEDAFNALTDFVIFGGNVFYALSVAAVYVLRFTRPDLPRPYRTWGYPVTPAIFLAVFAFLLYSLLIQTLYQALAGTVLLLIGAIVFYVNDATGNSKTK